MTIPPLPPDHRVVVIGNGPVGQTAALLLASWGVPVLLLDARPQRDAVGSKAICQQRDVLDVWEHVGVGAQVAAEGVTWTTARTFYRDEELFAQGFVDRGSSPFPPFVNISQTRTEQLLDERIAASPLVETRWDARVVGLAQDADRVRLDIASSWESDVERERGRGEEPDRVEAAYVVVASGARSNALRDLLGVTFDGRTFSDQFLICDIRTDLPAWETERRFYFDPEWNPGRQVLIHPCPDSTFRIDWQVPPDFDLVADEASGALDARIRQVVGDRPYEIVWKSQYRFHSRCVDRMRVGRVLVAGDSAHLVAPFGARGLNSGVQDAENAAWKLAFVLRGWAGEGLLDSYHDERHAAARENLDVTTATMRFLVPQSQAEKDERYATLAAAPDDPAARARVDSGRLAEPFWYVDSPLTTPCPGRAFGGRPPKGHAPDLVPGVLVPDVPITPTDGVTRLRELARRGVLVVCGDGVDVAAVRESLGGLSAPCGVASAADLGVAGHEGTRGAADDGSADGGPVGEVPRLPVGRGEAWVLRPDAHIAAIVGGPGVPAADVVTDVREAVRRALALDGGR